MNTFPSTLQEQSLDFLRVMDIVMLVDQDILNRNATTMSRAAKLTQQASSLKNLVNVFGTRNTCIALVSENDPTALCH